MTALKGKAAKVSGLALAFAKTSLFLQLITSMMAFPGVIYLLDAYNVLPAALAPAVKEMKIKVKFGAIGIKYSSPECKGIMALVGAGKIAIPFNHFVLKGGLDLFYAIVASIGFPLVIYVHRVKETDPIAIDVIVLFFIAAFWRIWLLGKKKVD